MTLLAAACDREIVNRGASPSLADASLIESAGVSSSAIVVVLLADIDGGIDRVGEFDCERLVQLVRCVLDRLNGELLAPALRNGERLRRNGDVEAGSAAPAFARTSTLASASVPSVRLTVYVACSPSLTVAGPVIENFCASSAPAGPGSAIRQPSTTPATPSRRTFARVISECPHTVGLVYHDLRFETKDPRKPTRVERSCSCHPAGLPILPLRADFCFLHSQIQRNERPRQRRGLSYARVGLLRGGN